MSLDNYITRLRPAIHKWAFRVVIGTVGAFCIVATVIVWSQMWPAGVFLAVLELSGVIMVLSDEH